MVLMIMLPISPSILLGFETVPLSVFSSTLPLVKMTVVALGEVYSQRSCFGDLYIILPFCVTFSVSSDDFFS